MTAGVGIYIYDDVEVLDFCGPLEVFCTASRMKSRMNPETQSPFQVFTIADAMRPIRARGGLTVQPTFDITQHPHISILIIPGGIHTAEMKRAEIIDWITRTASRAKITASVCTGAFLLAQAGLLRGKTVTTHWEDLNDLHAQFPDVKVIGEKRWVDAGTVFTSAGISAGLDLSLHLVARWEGEALASRTARQMDYEWRSTP